MTNTVKAKHKWDILQGISKTYSTSKSSHQGNPITLQVAHTHTDTLSLSASTCTMKLSPLVPCTQHSPRHWDECSSCALLCQCYDYLFMYSTLYLRCQQTLVVEGIMNYPISVTCCVQLFLNFLRQKHMARALF